jgi:hypothetical protein
MRECEDKDIAAMLDDITNKGKEISSNMPSKTVDAIFTL